VSVDVEMEDGWLREQIAALVRTIDPEAKSIMFPHLGRITSHDVRCTPLRDTEYVAHVMAPDQAKWRDISCEGPDELTALFALGAKLSFIMQMTESNPAGECERELVALVSENCVACGLGFMVDELRAAPTVEKAREVYERLVRHGRLMSSGHYGSLD
jgi:hypothetical protein